MQYRAVIKRSDGWWIGWLVDLPGVNAQEGTREELIESLRIGAREMLATEVPLDAEGQLITIDVPLPCTALEHAEANAARADG
jgi:predicted RNase H-like HicB family nuclease